MALYTLKELYQGLPERNYAVVSFNVYNLEFTQGVIQAAEQEDAPVILMISEVALDLCDLNTLANSCLFIARESKIPVAVILDHGKTRDIIERCIALGISVMFDGSHLSLEENIRQTREFAHLAHRAHVSIEGEIGRLVGIEDSEETTSEALTRPEDAAKFVRETGVDALAVAIGNCHGFYQAAPNLDIARLRSIKELVEIPLVLHGGSDLPDEQVREAIDVGIKKINIGTDIKYAFARQLQSDLNRQPMPFQPVEILSQAKRAICEEARKKIVLSRSSGLASHFRLA